MNDRPDNIYVDLYFYNNVQQENSVSAALFYDNITPIIQKASEYDISVVRASVDVSALPIFAFGSYYARSGSSDITVSNTSDYYSDGNVYSIEQFLSSLNAPLSAYGITVGYNNTTGIFNITNPGTTALYFNTALKNLFATFVWQPDNYQFADGSYAWKLIPGTANPVVQESSGMSNWPDISNIFIITNNVPVYKSPINFGNAAITNTVYNQESSNILIDFLYPITTGSNNVIPTSIGTIQYLPQSVYRQVSLTGNSPISSIGLQIYYQTKSGNLKPLTLNFGSSVSVKILFTRKR